LGFCVNHPERETSFGCMKHNIYMCQECLDCRDPEIYCKFRSSCPIHFLTKRKGNLDGDSDLNAYNVANRIEKNFVWEFVG
jgi:hypothetical protein